MRRRLKLTAEQQELAAAYVPFAQRLARPFCDRFPRMADDLRSSSLLALCEAAATYDPARGLKFATFAALRINGEIRDELRRQAPKGFRTNGTNAAAAPRLEPLTRHHAGQLIDPAPPAELVVERLDQAETILARLPPLARQAVVLCFVEALSRAAAARILRVSRGRIDAALRRARACA